MMDSNAALFITHSNFVGRLNVEHQVLDEGHFIQICNYVKAWRGCKKNCLPLSIAICNCCHCHNHLILQKSHNSQNVIVCDLKLPLLTIPQSSSPHPTYSLRQKFKSLPRVSFKYGTQYHKCRVNLMATSFNVTASDGLKRTSVLSCPP